MRRPVLPLLLAFGLFFACRAHTPVGRYWVDRAEKLKPLQGEDVVAIASMGAWLYVSTGRRVFLVRPDGSETTDVTARVKRNDEDQITNILVDSNRNELWIVFNSNTLLSSCYGENLEPGDCPRTFLDERIALMEKLRKNGPGSSVDALAFDGEQAIVSYFKGDIYLYSLRDHRQQLAYKPSSPGHWGISAALTNRTGIVVTRGDGLIVVDRKTAAAMRFPDRGANHIQ